VGLGFSLGQCGQEHASQNGDDRDDNQQFDEREGSRLYFFVKNNVKYHFLIRQVALSIIR
jgi:hypothetical protein